MGLVQPTMKPAQLQDSAQVEKEAHQERPTRIWTFCIRNPDLFQKLLRPSHLLFLSGIFTSGIMYFFLFASPLLIPRNLRLQLMDQCRNRYGWTGLDETKFGGRNFTSLVLDIDKIK